MTSRKLFLYAILAILAQPIISAQTRPEDSKHKIAIGLNYGFGNQAVFPFNNTDYQYKSSFYKVQFRYPFTNKKQWNFEAVVQPSYFRIKHRLLNKFFIKPEDSDNYIELREKFTQERIINEFALQIGALCRFNITENLSVYAILGSGPMILEKESERQAKGFSFSNSGGLGLMYKINSVFFDIRGTLRHVSNLQLIEPNNGYNSMALEFGISTEL